MKNLKALFNECMSEVKAIGIEPGNIVDVSINTRAKKRWGQCKYSNGVYTINISNRLLADELDDMVAKNTITHEILHSCKGCMNHGPEWKALADKVNNAYPGYNIKRTTSCEEKGIEAPPPRPFRYEVFCVDCGTSYKYKRISRVVENPSRFCCGKCKGQLKAKSLVPGVEIYSAK